MTSGHYTGLVYTGETSLALAWPMKRPGDYYGAHARIPLIIVNMRVTLRMDGGKRK